MTLGPLNIMASLGTGEALASGALAAIIGLLNETAAAKDGRRQVVATGFAGLDHEAVDQWLARDSRHLTLAVQAVLRATAAFDQQKVDVLGRAFRAGVLDDAKVDESLFVVAAPGVMERPHIDLLRVVAMEAPPAWTEQPHLPADVGANTIYRGMWSTAGLSERLPHLAVVMPVLELQLRTSGVTRQTQGFTAPMSDVTLTALGKQCIEYLAISKGA